MINLAHDLITGRKAISSLTLDECLALIERICNDECVEDFRRDAEFYEWDEMKTLKEAQFGVEVILVGAKEDPEYQDICGVCSSNSNKE